MAQRQLYGEATHPPENGVGLLVEANMVNVQDTMLAPIKQVDTELEGLTQEELSEFVNMLKVIKVDRGK